MKEIQNFSERTVRLLGKDSYDKLEQTHIAIFGVGGVGSWAAESLVRSGVGELTLIDFDTIEASNINRQIHALQSTIGLYKIDVMAERLQAINPNVKLHLFRDKINEESHFNFISSVDYTIDCIDDVKAKVALICWHIQHNKKIVCSMGTGNKLGNKPFILTDISKTKVCPLAKAVRLRLRKEGIYKGVDVLYSEENPKNPVEIGMKPGTICFVPAIAGLELSKYVINKILN